METFNIGQIISYVQSVGDGSNEKIYLECVENNEESCRGCYVGKPRCKANKKAICQRCQATQQDIAQPIKFSLHHILYE